MMKNNLLKDLGLVLETGIPTHMFIAAAMALGGSILAFSFSIKTLALMVSFALLTLGFNSLNSISDIKEDTISRRYRPIPSGKISPKRVLIFSSLAFLASFLLVAWNSSVLILTLIDALLLVIYSFGVRLKRYLFFSNLVISLHYTTFALLAGWLSSRPLLDAPVFIIFLLFLWGAVFSMFEDFCDYVGDKISGIRTLPTVFGVTKARVYIKYLNYVPYTILALGVSFGLLNPYFLLLFITLIPTSMATSLLPSNPKKANSLVLSVSVLHGALVVLIYTFTVYL